MTIKDVANESGYSVGTVSRCLNHAPGVSEKARRAIMAVVDKHHFRLNSNARNLKQQHQQAGIAIVIKGMQNMLFAEIMEKIQGLITRKGYEALVYYFEEDENEVLAAREIVEERRPQGILFLGSNLENFEHDFEGINIPCVLVTNSGAHLNNPLVSSVSTDDRTAAEYAIDQLVEKGHRRIGILGGKRSASNAAGSRFLGCEDAFRKHHLDYGDQKQYEEAYFNIPSGYTAMKHLLSRMPELTAVFAMSDTLAIGAIRALLDSGKRVPEDVSVIGFDGLEIGNYMQPRLTTIRQHQERMAERSVDILLDCIEQNAMAVHEIEAFHLVPGESIAANEK
ncbi:MAG TPA: LacI family transcriptional regulator [Lachnospiraceae bacterium]|nr:LacI family transcriptional regulator [Lachnospiraceae bacterium]